MNQLLEKFSYAETINEASQVKSLSRLASREIINQHKEVISCSESIVWKQKSVPNRTNKASGKDHSDVVDLIRKSYNDGKIYINSSVPKDIDLELSIILSAGLKNLLSSTRADGHIGICLRFVNSRPCFYRVFPVEVQRDLGQNVMRASLGAQEVILQSAQSSRKYSNRTRSAEV